MHCSGEASLKLREEFDQRKVAASCSVKKFPDLGKSNEAVSEEAASLSEEGYRRADCSPPEHTLRDSERVDGRCFPEVSIATDPKEYSLPPSRENLHWKEGFKPKASGAMIVVSGAAP